MLMVRLPSSLLWHADHSAIIAGEARAWRLNEARKARQLLLCYNSADRKWRDSKMSTLSGLKVAILVADGFEQVEMTEPRKALQEAGADTRIVSPARRQVQGWNHHDKADKFDVDVALDDAQSRDFGALLLPGGVANPDQLRTLPHAVDFVREFVQAGKPVAVICHGPWTLVEADVVKGRNMTSWPSVKTDLVNAGAHWTDQEVVVDQGPRVESQARRPAGFQPGDDRGVRQGPAAARQGQRPPDRRSQRPADAPLTSRATVSDPAGGGT